ncbi:hypothetical protein KIPB_013219 [Kipferlia bialata]|uniref:NSF attachment protein n=1 Tax=Kipferlia bialata TaxID=797122 RepID=A0A9K3D981_9EUKA|nr:hypothetical protein KIPB_013219 [Kipferlia bialata]|eukprot:g13219.t1
MAINQSSIEKAHSYFKLGQKKLKKPLFDFNRETRLEEAAESFERAANLYKSVKQWELAGDAFRMAGEAMVGASSEVYRSPLKVVSVYYIG